MRKIFVNNIDGDYAVLTGDKHDHLAFSLRVRPGDKIVLCSGGIDYETEVTAVSKNQTELKVLSATPCDCEPSIDVALFFAIMKGDKNELVAQKATELGVIELHPFISQNCECKRESFKLDRIQRIIVEAAEQCGRGFIPVLFGVLDCDEVIKKLNSYDLVIFANERETEVGLKEVLRGVEAKNVAVIIGSEGGFTADEADNFIANGAKSVTLGRRILRAETANIAVLSAIMYEENQWTHKR